MMMSKRTLGYIKYEVLKYFLFSKISNTTKKNQNLSKSLITCIMLIVITNVSFYLSGLLLLLVMFKLYIICSCLVFSSCYALTTKIYM